MNYNQQLIAMMSDCEAVAKACGHTLSVWYPVDEQRLHAFLCEVCRAMGWVTRSGAEKQWRIGGSALKQKCLEEDQGSAWKA
jgi:hypothetical protein